MYLKYFGFSEKPFALLPDPRMLFWSKAHSEAFAMMQYGVVNGAPITVITGEVGAGKTTLIRHLLNELDDSVVVGLVSNVQRGKGEMLHWCMMALGMRLEGGVSYVQHFHDFQNKLIENFEAGKRTILIVDEAQNLDADALEELRMFSNINSDKDELLQLILVGQPELGEMVSRPELKQFAQRIASLYHVPNLSAAETKAYIKHRIAEAGGNPGIFTTLACQLVYKTSQGTPRLINVIADLALVHCFSRNRRQVSRNIILEIIPYLTRFGAFRAACSDENRQS
jgi:type II secretory pathway predicted ATPase ExeA